MFKVKLLTISLLSVFMFSLSASAQWYSGGTLHRANGAVWKSSSESNRLATSADFAIIIIGKNRVQAMGSMNRLKPYALQMKICIDEAVVGRGGNKISVSEVGAACGVLLGWS